MPQHNQTFNTPRAKRLSTIAVYLLLAALIYFPLFSHLGSFPIRIWDEARLAISAYEMLNNHDYIVTYHAGEPDMWSTKPPLMIWLQVMCMKVFGVGEFAVRLPSAIAGLFTCIALLLFSNRYFKDKWLGIIAVLVLITTNGYIHQHVTRTGDYDSLLILFTTVSGFAFFAYCEHGRVRWLYIYFIIITLAALTKSVAGLMFTPALVVYAIWSKQLISLLKNKHFYLGAVGFLTVVVGYYFLREHYNPGYIEAILQNDLGGRFSNVEENHKNHNWFYYDNMFNYQFTAWHMLFPCGLIVGYLSKDQRIRKATVFSSLMVFVFFIVITIADTKLEWYNAPMYPFMAIIVAVLIYYVFNYLKNLDWIKQTLKANPFPLILLFLLFTTPYRAILQKTYMPEEEPWNKDFYEISYYLRDGLRGVHDLSNKTLCYDGYHTQLDFYLHLMNEKGTNVHLKDWTKVEPGEIVFTYQDNIKDYLTQNFKVDTLNQFYRVTTYQLHERIQPVE